MRQGHSRHLRAYARILHTASTFPAWSRCGCRTIALTARTGTSSKNGLTTKTHLTCDRPRPPARDPGDTRAPPQQCLRAAPDGTDPRSSHRPWPTALQARPGHRGQDTPYSCQVKLLPLVGWCGSSEGDRFVDLLMVGQAVAEPAERAVEQITEGGVIAVAGVPAAVVVGMCAGRGRQRGERPMPAGCGQPAVLDPAVGDVAVLAGLEGYWCASGIRGPNGSR